MNELLSRFGLDALLIKNISAVFSSKIISFAVPLLILPYITKVLGLEQFGLLSFSLAISQYLVIVTTYGFDLTATQQISKARNDKKAISDVFCNVITAKLLIALLCLLLLIATFCINNSSSSVMELVAYSYIGVLGAGLSVQWLYQGKEKLGIFSAMRVMSQLATLPFYFIFVKNGSDTHIAILLLSIPSFTSSIVGILYAYRKGWMLWSFLPRVEGVHFQLKNGWYVFVSNVIGSLYLNTIPVLLGVLSGPASVGIYSAAYKIFQASQSLYQAITSSYYPRVNATLQEKGRVETIAFIVKLLKLQLFLGLSVGGGIFIMSDFIVHFIYSDSYNDSSIVLKLFSVLPVIIGVGSVLGIQTLLTFDLKKEMMKVYTTCAIFSLFISIPLSFLYQEYGAAISVILVELLVTLLMYRSVKKYVLSV